MQSVFDSPMVIVGFLGQALFCSRFMVQWIASERARTSVMPTLFWWLSLAGGTTLLCYAVWRMDPVFIVGQATGLLIYARNLMLIGRAQKARPA